MNQRSHLILPSKYSRINLIKRSSTSNLHPGINSLQQSSSRGKLSDRGSAESKREKKKNCKRSRFQWISVLRDEMLRHLSKNCLQLPIKQVIAFVESSKQAPNENQTPCEEQIDAQEVVRLFRKTSKTKIGIDLMIWALASNVNESRVSNNVKKHSSCTQSVQPGEDPETARFNDNCSLNIAPFGDSMVSQQMTSSDARLNSCQEQQIGPEYVTLFDQIFRDNCDNIRLLQKTPSLTPVDKRFTSYLLDYGMYHKNGELFCGVKLFDLEGSVQLTKTMKSPEVKQFLKYIQAIRIFKCQINLQPLMTSALKIVNLSDNNLTNISFLSVCSQLEFLNVNHNQLKTLSPIKDHKNLMQIHCLNNFLQVPLPSHSFQKLEILDLGYNQIVDCRSIELLADIKSLNVLNLMGNPLLQCKANYKKDLSATFPNLRTFVYSEVYILSEYSLFKDITFFMNEERPLKQNQSANRNSY